MLPFHLNLRLALSGPFTAGPRVLHSTVVSRVGPSSLFDLHGSTARPPRGASAHRTYCSPSPAEHPDISSTKPQVVIVSWLGARQQHFDKYVQLWRAMGHEHVVAIRPPITSVLFPALADLMVREQLSSLEGSLLSQPTRPTILHLLSGGGFIFAAAMLQQLAIQQQHNHQQQQQQQQGTAVPGGAQLQAGSSSSSSSSSGSPASALLRSIQGVVLDSSPSPITGDVAARAITAALLAEAADGVEARHPLLVGSLRGALEAYLQLPPIQHRMSQAWETWSGGVLPPVPLLLLYSEADPLVPPSFVEDWGAAQARRGAAVQYGKWQDSPHVEHFRCHPLEYRQRLEAFLGSLPPPPSGTP